MFCQRADGVQCKEESRDYRIQTILDSGMIRMSMYLTSGNNCRLIGTSSVLLSEDSLGSSELLKSIEKIRSYEGEPASKYSCFDSPIGDVVWGRGKECRRVKIGCKKNPVMMDEIRSLDAEIMRGLFHNGSLNPYDVWKTERDRFKKD